MRRGDKVIVEVDGKKYEGIFLGKGKFSKVFRVGDRVVYYTRGDCAKEVVARFAGRYIHIPELIEHDKIRMRGLWISVYSSPIYRDVKATDRSAWSLMNTLIKEYRNFQFTHSFMGGSGFSSGVEIMEAFVDRLKRRGKVPHSIINALNFIIDVAVNCGEWVTFDFHRKNFGVNEYGTLIFRDVFWVYK